MVINGHKYKAPVIDIMQGRAVSTAALNRHTPGHPGHDNDGYPITSAHGLNSSWLGLALVQRLPFTIQNDPGHGDNGYPAKSHRPYSHLVDICHIDKGWKYAIFIFPPCTCITIAWTKIGWAGGEVDIKKCYRISQTAIWVHLAPMMMIVSDIDWSL